MSTAVTPGVDNLAEALRRTPATPAFLDRRARPVLSRGGLADAADWVAADLHARGLAEGETVAVAVRPGPAALAVLLAAVRLRLRVALVDPAAGPEVVTARLAMAAPRLVVADAAAQAAASWAAPLARRRGLHLPRLDRLAPVVTLGRRWPGSAPALGSAPVLGAGARRGAVPDRRGGDADLLVVFTSGTTGSPRAVVHRTSSLDAALAAVLGLAEVRAGAPVVGSTFFVMAPALLAGAPVALPARGARALAAQHTTLRPQLTYLVPPQVRDLLAAGAPVTGRFFAGSAPVTAQLLSRLRMAGAAQAWGVYAMTEAFPVAVVESAEKAAFDGAGDLVGAVVPGLAARTDAAGQLHVAGAAVCHRYLGEQPHREVATGDLGQVMNGRLVLQGRVKDMVLRRAENIYPGLYEPALHVPGVALAVLVGVPTDDLDESLVLLVQPEPGASPRTVRAALEAPLARMGSARPDELVWGTVPSRGRSGKPDRAAAAALAARLRGAR